MRHYNHANGNWTAFRLFNDANYLSAHRGLPGAGSVLQDGVSQSWAGETWPDGFPTAEDTSVNGFILEADFYKFRGRGIIQTTGRADYDPIVEYILTNAGAQANPTLAALAAAWTQGVHGNPDPTNAIASKSSNRDWDAAFGEAVILAAGIRIDSDSKGHYLDLSHDAAILNAGVNSKGSLYFMARKINGGGYPDQVVPMMKAMIDVIARANGPVAVLRIPRDLDDAPTAVESIVRPANSHPWEETSKNGADDDAAWPQNEVAPAAAPAAQWRVAKSLLVLRGQVDRAAPNRKKGNDGAIGDAAHQTRDSDHNPWVRDGSIGVVTALDITHDPAGGCDAGRLAEAIRTSRDARVKYLIWNRHIANHLGLDGTEAWAWRPYNGSNPHDHHVHISVISEKAEYDSVNEWSIATASVA